MIDCKNMIDRLMTKQLSVINICLLLWAHRFGNYRRNVKDSGYLPRQVLL